MINTQKNTNQKGISPLAAGLTGIVLGAAGTAAVALSDDATRTKVTKKAVYLKKNLQNWGKNTAKDIQKEMLDAHTDLKKRTGLLKEEAKDQVEKVKKSVKDV